MLLRAMVSRWARRMAKMDEQLQEAAEQGNVAFLTGKDEEYFLRRTREKRNIIHIAAAMGQESFIQEALRSYPILLRQGDSKGNTPLHFAAWGGHIAVAKLLVTADKSLPREAEAKARPSTWRPFRDIEGQKLAEQRLPLLRIPNSQGSTALHHALRNEHEQLALYLLEEDPYLAFTVNKAGESPLYLAAEKGCKPVMNKILSSQAEFKIEGPYGRNPLHAMATHSDAMECAELLLKKTSFALIFEEDKFKRTALHYAAAASGSEKFIRYVYEKHRNAAKLRDREGLTPLLIAARMGRVENVKVILELCPDSIGCLDNRGRNALHLAVGSDYSFVVAALMEIPEMQRLVNKQDNKGNTPFHIAILKRRCWVIKDLLATKCIDLWIKNKSGSSPSSLCHSDPEFQKFASEQDLWRCFSEQNPPLRGGQSPVKGILPAKEIESSEKEIEEWKQDANSLSVVAGLLTTITFAAAFTIPGGFNSDPPDKGLAVLGKNAAFQIFVLSDTVAVCFSIIVVVFLLISRTEADSTILERRFVYSINMLVVALFGTLVAFMSGLWAVIPGEALWIAILVCFIGCSFPYVFGVLVLSANDIMSFQDALLRMLYSPVLIIQGISRRLRRILRTWVDEASDF